MSVWFDDEYTGQPIRPKTAHHELPEIVHKFGDVSVNPHHVAAELDGHYDNEGIRWGRDPKWHYGADGIDDADYDDERTFPWRCNMCGYRHEHEPLVAGGDESISVCKRCGSHESVNFEEED